MKDLGWCPVAMFNKSSRECQCTLEHTAPPRGITVSICKGGNGGSAMERDPPGSHKEVIS